MYLYTQLNTTFNWPIQCNLLIPDFFMFSLTLEFFPLFYVPKMHQTMKRKSFGFLYCVINYPVKQKNCKINGQKQGRHPIGPRPPGPSEFVDGPMTKPNGVTFLHLHP